MDINVIMESRIRGMSNGFIYVVDAHFIDKIETKKILDPSACDHAILIIRAP
jgi:hypothetical protein